MQTASCFSDLFDYDSTANRRVLDLLRDSAFVNEEIRGLLAHIVSAKKVWMKRLKQEHSSSIAIWPDLDWKECEALIEENRDAYRNYLAEKAADDLTAKVHYQNSKGAAFETPVRDILNHILIHGGYHRGQIAKKVREAGGEPINTDYITYVRELD